MLAAAAAATALAAFGEVSALEDRLKAAFLYKFAGYVEWPEGAFRDNGSPIAIGVAGSETIAQELEQALPGHKVGERTMTVHRIEPGAGDLAGYQIIFVGRGVESARVAELLRRASGKPVLTVTDATGDAPSGSVINFLNDAGHVRFDIAMDAASRNGLHLRAPLLAVARKVSTP